MVMRVQSIFISKVNGCAFFLGLCPDSWKGFGLPGGNLRGVLLPCLVERPLCAKAQRLHDPVH